MALALPVIGVTPRVQEIGRIRMGEKSPKGFPVKLRTFRLTSNDKGVLEAAAALYGSEGDRGVRAWPDAPDEGQWQLTTAATELDILIPRSLRSVSQAWELWQGGTCERRCDGATESISGQPCLCGDARGSSDDLCDIMTRLSVILPRLPGLGVWRLDTGGWHAATTIPATIDLLLALDPRPMVPAVLRAVQASSKVRENGKVVTHRFVRPQLDAPGVTIGQLVAVEPLALTSGDAAEPTRLPTAEERAARKRAEIEAQRAETQPAQDAPGAADEGAQLPVSTDDADAAGQPSDEAEGEVREVAGISRDELLAGLDEIGVSAAYAAETSKRMFGKAQLTDEQRAELLEALRAEQATEAL